MNIIGYKSGGHDGTICYVNNGKLIYGMEAEKGSGYRYSLFTPDQFDHTIYENWKVKPSIICGDSSHFGSPDVGVYCGFSFDDIVWSKCQTGGEEVDYASVPHELAHITCTYALSDLQNGEECYVLLWEGYIGNFYHIDKDFNITKLGNTEFLMEHVGVKYIFPYHATGKVSCFDNSSAGKIMALAGLASCSNIDDSKEKALAKKLVHANIDLRMRRVSIDDDWGALYESLHYLRNVPLDDPYFVALCKAFQDEIYNHFFLFAKKHIKKKLPLLITGGCGLNCEWNTNWRNSGLFTSVFVPPVPNDCGIAIGAAAAIQFLKTGNMKLDWRVYIGDHFYHEDTDLKKFGFKKYPLDFDFLSELLYDKNYVVAWIQGNYEIGPRALCHRSLIAAPFSIKTRDELNRIKQREYFRPVAPVCLEEDVSEHFDWEGPSPYMLYFQKVKSSKLAAVTHMDGAARVQTINIDQEPKMHQLLQSFKKKTGVGVLCNTSLNFLGRGFINSTSEAIDYIFQRDIPVMVIDDTIYIRKEFGKVL